jgi:CheY-like chemotaxis protein
MANKSKRVFLIEDDELFRDAITDVLRTKGYSVDSAPNGVEALSQLRASEVLPRVIFVDLTMPIMDGPAFCAALREDAALREIPIVIISAHPSDNSSPPGMAQGYLRKPFTIESLLEATRPYCS